METRTSRRRYDAGGVVFGAILLVVGVWFLLQETFGLDLPEVNWDQVWPLILILIGVAVLYGAWRRRSEG